MKEKIPEKQEVCYQIVNVKDTKKGLKIIRPSMKELRKNVIKNYSPEQCAEDVSNKVKVRVLPSGVIISDYQWEKHKMDKKGINYSKMMATYLTADAQNLILKKTGEPVHQIVFKAFYKKYCGKDYISNGTDIHHIDNNALNNQLWNLVVLDRTTHLKKVHNSKH